MTSCNLKTELSSGLVMRLLQDGMSDHLVNTAGISSGSVWQNGSSSISASSWVSSMNIFQLGLPRRKCNFLQFDVFFQKRIEHVIYALLVWKVCVCVRETYWYYAGLILAVNTQKCSIITCICSFYLNYCIYSYHRRGHHNPNWEEVKKGHLAMLWLCYTR